MDASNTTAPAVQPAAIERIAVGDSLTIYSVEAFADSARAALAHGVAVEVDLSSVNVCDTLGIQALCALQRSARSTGRPLRFVPSAAVQLAAAAIGCEGLLREEARP